VNFLQYFFIRKDSCQKNGVTVSVSLKTYNSCFLSSLHAIAVETCWIKK